MGPILVIFLVPFFLSISVDDFAVLIQLYHGLRIDNHITVDETFLTVIHYYEMKNISAIPKYTNEKTTTVTGRTLFSETTLVD